MKQSPQQIYLGQELWNDELVTRLVGLGHHVTPFATAPGMVIVSRHAWRISKSITQAELAEHVGMILKQARLLEHEGTSEEPPPGGADKKPKSPAKRKRSTKGKAVIPRIEVQEGTGSEGRSEGFAQPANAAGDTTSTEQPHSRITEEHDVRNSGC